MADKVERTMSDYAWLCTKRAHVQRSLIGMCVRRQQRPQPVQLEDVPDPDGVNQRVGVLASLVAAHPGLVAVIQALVNPGLPSRMTPAAAMRTLDPDAAHRDLKLPGRWTAPGVRSAKRSPEVLQ